MLLLCTSDVKIAAVYTKQKLHMILGCSTACNRIKQGVILSPIFISVYKDGLFEKLEKSGVGCHMGNHYTGGIGYADDLALLTPARSGLKVIIDICKHNADDYYVQFYCMQNFRVCSCKLNNRTVVVNRTELQSVQDAVHLGHHVCTVNKDSLIADGIANSGEGIAC